MTYDEGEALVQGCSKISDIEGDLKREMKTRSEFSEVLWVWWAWELQALRAETGIDIKCPSPGLRLISDICIDVAEHDFALNDPVTKIALDSVDIKAEVGRYLAHFNHEKNSPHEISREIAEYERIRYLLLVSIEHQRRVLAEIDA